MNDFEFEIELVGVPSDFGILSLEIKNEEITFYLGQESSHMDIRSCSLKLTNEKLFLIEDTLRNSLYKDIFLLTEK